MCEWYPFLKDEVLSTSFQRDIAVIEFHNGSIISNLGNSQTTKGQRRHRGSIDESARLNNAIFKDAVEPVFSLRRWTNGDEQDKYELNGQLNFFTTAGFRGTEEFIRTINFINDMADLKGAYVFGANWELPVYFNLLTKKYVMDIKNDETTSPIAFLQNYESVWVGAGEGALVSMDKVNNLRTSDIKPIFKRENVNEEYLVAMDVARSQFENNNKSAFVVGKINRSKNGNVRSVDIVYIYTPPSGLTFREQCVILKRLQKIYGAKMCIVDINGVGRAMPDEVIHETVDSETGEVYDAWAVGNMDVKPDTKNAPVLLYGMNATGINHEIIVNFWDYIESGKVRFLVSERNIKFNSKTSEEDKVLITQAHMQTDKLIEELSNLKAEKMNNGKYTVKQVTRKIDKDRYSALAYLLYYVQNFENVKKQNNEDLLDVFFYN